MLMIFAMLLSILHLVIILWFAFIGVVMATICDGTDAGAANPEVATFCDLMGLMTLCAVARFASVLTASVCSCVMHSLRCQRV